MENNNATQRSTRSGPQTSGGGPRSPNPGPRKRLESFKDLKTWQKSFDLVREIYRVTKTFPYEELYGLTAQMRRSAVSVPSNIAEGFQRWHEKEFKQHLNIALASLAELETQVLIAGELKYLDKPSCQNILETINHTTKMAVNLAKKIPG
jgi:four helix bundle protein